MSNDLLDGDVSIERSHWLNTRHKIAIAIAALLVIILQGIMVYYFTLPKVEGDHMECIELSKEPTCLSEKNFYAYEVRDNGKNLTRIEKANTCYEYYSHPNMVSNAGSFLEVFASIIAVIDIFVGMYLLCVIGDKLWNKIKEWWKSVDEEDYDEE